MAAVSQWLNKGRLLYKSSCQGRLSVGPLTLWSVNLDFYVEASTFQKHKSRSCMVSWGLCSEVTPCPFDHALLVKTSHRSTQNKSREMSFISRWKEEWRPIMRECVHSERGSLGPVPQETALSAYSLARNTPSSCLHKDSHTECHSRDWHAPVGYPDVCEPHGLHGNYTIPQTFAITTTINGTSVQGRSLQFASLPREAAEPIAFPTLF